MSTKHILSSAAIAALIAGSAIAESHVSADTAVDGATTGAIGSADTSADVGAAGSVATDTNAATGGGDTLTTTDPAATDTATVDTATGADAMVDVNIAEIDAEALTGARVYDQNDKWIGEVSEVLVGADGTSSQAVIDVGGFLGIGEKPVALSFDDLSIKSNGDADYTVYVALTEAELEAMPSYEG